ncbi:MAG: DUF3499 family protein [Actinomycetia bacterium]|nr:DUF3499 family protein [Actinomycetes bacterium]MCP4959605.1 DUF3499 family protein [Actinomycetes bacterium]
MGGCVRFDCVKPAAAGLALDHEHQRVTIIDRDTAIDLLLIELCHHHADEVTMPTGWVIDDDRAAQQSLFVAELLDTAAPASVSRLDHRRARQERTIHEPTLFSAPERADENKMEDKRRRIPIEPIEPIEDEDSPWIGQPELRHSELLEVDETSPLLARAFRASRAS